MWNGIFKKTTTVFLVLFFIAASPPFAEEKEKQQHPIDAWLGKCIEADFATAGMTNCALKAMEMWDREMNRTYKELMKKLPGKQKALLKQSQIQWVKFRDVEFNFTSEFYGSFEGTIWQNTLAGEKLNVVKDRALRLQMYLNYLRKA